MNTKECTWTQDEDGNYTTGCHHSFFFNDGGAAENQAAFCLYCGGKLIDAPFIEEEIAT